MKKSTAVLSAFLIGVNCFASGAAAMAADSELCCWSKGELLSLIASLCAVPCADRQILSRHTQQRWSTHGLSEHCSGHS